MPSKRDKNGRFVPKSTNDNERLLDSIDNVVQSRSAFLRKFLDPRRDIDDECGYPKNLGINEKIYRILYDREPVANRVVQVLPRESWQSSPTIVEDEDPDKETPFEAAWKQVASSLRGPSWFESDADNSVWEHLVRADILSGIGHYGVLLIGVDDGQDRDLREPIQSARHLLFLRAFDESQCQVTRFENDTSSPRFGHPTEYLVHFNDPDEHDHGGVGQPIASRNVHWSRVIHVADNLGSSEVFGVPRMRPVLNRLYDLRKLYAGSAEMYWRGAFPGLSIETHPQLQGDIEMDKEGMRQQMQDYMDGLQRYLALMGMSAKSLAPQVVDPTPQVDTQIEAICVQLGIPKRVFVGSERGELASSQDDSAWNDRLRHRQDSYITPRIIVPFIDRLIMIGILPEPQSYKVVWPDLDALTAQESAQVAVMKTDALSKYVGGNVEAMMTPMDYLTRVLDFDDSDAESIVDAAAQAAEEMEVELDDALIPEPETPFA